MIACASLALIVSKYVCLEFGDVRIVRRSLIGRSLQIANLALKLFDRSSNRIGIGKRLPDCLRECIGVDAYL